ncbi:tyrosine-protein phosphatase [Candidatus Stoquefichus massiliensis]|uniref:tyrosine-protein phosphatase n=1 Tax=Candidatus Stoquefichus massiliensis TaxID=1470350 RepID=UPI0004857218|nr:tyrosine-protein phosphatase [Candidatus Stoquefichus massiliensis]
MRELNIRNFRDVSGYKNKYGEIMKENMIFRGASLDAISFDDAQYMEEELGIRYILDYRDEQEANLAKDIVFPHAQYLRIEALQLKEHKDEGFDFGNMLQGKMTPHKLQFLIQYIQEGYKTMAFDNPAYHQLFKLLLQNDGHVYFHCSAGKDRTGISALLIMFALGMSEEDAIEEYLLSNQYLKEFVDDFYKEHHVPKMLRKYSDPLLLVQKENIMLTIDSIKEKYQDYDEFLEKEYGLDEEKRRLLRLIYCE